MKNWYQSRTIWGIVAAAIASLTGFVMEESELSVIATKLVEVAGLVYAIYGRITANEVIK